MAMFFNTSCSRPDGDKAKIPPRIDSLYALIRQGRNTDLSIQKRKASLGKVTPQIPSLENDTVRVIMYSKLSLAYLRLKDSANFRKTNSKTIDFATLIRDSLSMAEANWDLAEFYRMETVPDSAYYYYSKARDLFQSLGRANEEGTMLNNMATIQNRVKDYTGSELTTIKAIEILKPLNNYTQLYLSYNNLGVVTKGLKEYDRALEYYDMALAYQKQIKEKNILNLDLQNNIGLVYQEQGRYEESVPYFENVLRTESLIDKDPTSYALAINNLAKSRYKIDSTLDLSMEFTKAIKIQDSIGDIAEKSRTHFNFAEYYMSRSDSSNALNQAKMALSNSKASDNNERVLETLRLLTRIDPDNSYAYNQNYITLTDSLQEEERQFRDKFARIRFETDEYIAENEMLASEKQLWTGISVAVFLLGASAFVILSQRSKNQKLRFQQEQQAANQEIFNLMLSQKQKEEEGKKSEQKRISEELHDGILGKMMGARMVLTGLNQKSDKDAEIKRKKAIDVLQDVEKEVRTISHDLSNTAYQKLNNFILSVADLMESMEQTADIQCKLEFEKNYEWDSLSGEVKINTYRMIQESLQNAVKHANCKNVSVSFVVQNGNMHITISDDGTGFRKSRRKKGIGMRNIASRIEKLNGKWNISSSPGKRYDCSIGNTRFLYCERYFQKEKKKRAFFASIK